MNRKEENSHPPAENKGCFNLDVSVNLIPEQGCDPLESGVCRLAAERMTCLHFGTSQEKLWAPNTEQLEYDILLVPKMRSTAQNYFQLLNFARLDDQQNCLLLDYSVETHTGKPK